MLSHGLVVNEAITSHSLSVETMRLSHSDTLRRARLGAAGALLMLSLLACSQQGADHTATLRWKPVTKSNDGSPLTNIAGYRISYGQSLDSMKVVVLPDPRATSYVFKDLTSGTWYFSVAAFTNNGTQGQAAKVTEKRIR
jgi:hypothetical protein